MGNSAYKKEQAIIFNKNREYDKKREEERTKSLELDKSENPEKYRRRNRETMRNIMPFIALSAASGFKI